LSVSVNSENMSSSVYNFKLFWRHIHINLILFSNKTISIILDDLSCYIKNYKIQKLLNYCLLVTCLCFIRINTYMMILFVFSLFVYEFLFCSFTYVMILFVFSLFVYEFSFCSLAVNIITMMDTYNKYYLFFISNKM
jgi:hypothetical protein